MELSLSPHFRREYPSVYSAIQGFNLSPEAQRELLGMIAPEPEERPFWLFSTDTTPHPRPYAKTLADRSYVHAPTPLKSNKPVTVGHAYSTVVILPEKEAGDPPWVIPASARRVKSQEDVELVGAEQLDELLTDPAMPWHGELVVHVGDASYSKLLFLWRLLQHSDTVGVKRVRSNRVFYRPHQPDPEAKKGRGCPCVSRSRGDVQCDPLRPGLDQFDQTFQTRAPGVDAAGGVLGRVGAKLGLHQLFVRLSFHVFPSP